MADVSPVRLAVAIAAGLGVATGLFLQASSSVSTMKRPEATALLLVPNGLADEQRAVGRFVAGVKQESDVVPSANAAREIARSAFVREPLTPKAHAILGLSEPDKATQRNILAAATRINRRDALLQGTILEQQVAAQNFDAALLTLNRLLRVNPEQKATFFPILAQALKKDAALPAFGRILDGSAEWNEAFLDFAVRDKALLPNLARLREAAPLGSPEFDRQLVSGLAASGEMERAYSLFQKISTNPAGGADAGVLGWDAQLPPFDWQLADDTGLRAQRTRSGDKIELYVRSGKGGLVAQRLVRAPSGPFTVKIAQRISPADQVRDVRLQLSCPGQSEPFFDQKFVQGINEFEIASVPSECTFHNIGLAARAWSGSSDLRGTIDRVELIRR